MKIHQLNYQHKNGTQLFQGLDYQVQDQAVNFLIGKNGVGKSTLLDIFMGLRKADCDKDYDLGNDYVYISQFLPMLGKIPCKEVAQLILGVIHKRIQISLEDLKAIFPAPVYDFYAEKWDQYYFQLSGGEQKLFQIFLFLTSNKRLYVLDEPTASLDRRNVGLLFELIKGLHGKTFLIVTHDFRDLKIFDEYYLTILEPNQGTFMDRHRFEESLGELTRQIDFLDYFVKA